MPSFASRFLPRTIRGRVSVLLNGTLLVWFAVFLVYNYRMDRTDRLELKRTALEEQARILTPGVQSQPGHDNLRAYLAEARKQMEETHSDVHVVAAEVKGQFLQSGKSEAEDEGVADRLRESERNATHVAELGGKEFLVGSHRQGTTVVYVAEDLHDLRAAIRADLKRHLAAAAIALLFGIGIINGVLWLAFQRPLSTLTTAVGEIGSGKLGLQINQIGAKEFDILAIAINDMSRALADAENARAVQMRKARTIQDSLFPARMVFDGVTIAHHFQPAETVGGDYYDLLVLPDGSGLFCIADVTGHGVSAALVAGMVKICVLNAVEHSADPGEILGFVDRRLSAMNIPEMFASMLLIRLRREHLELEFAGAGHPAALLVDGAGGYRELKSEGPLVGIGADFSWTSQRAPFSRGDRLVLFTDGVTEASGRQQGLFGEARLRDIITATRNHLPSEAVQSIVKCLSEHFAGQVPQDDITLMIVDLQQIPG